MQSVCFHCYCNSSYSKLLSAAEQCACVKNLKAPEEWKPPEREIDVLLQQKKNDRHSISKLQ